MKLHTSLLQYKITISNCSENKEERHQWERKIIRKLLHFVQKLNCAGKVCHECVCVDVCMHRIQAFSHVQGYTTREQFRHYFHLHSGFGTDTIYVP